MEELCRKIGMPREVTQEVLLWHQAEHFQPDLSRLMEEGGWKEGLAQLQHSLGADPGGMKLLCCMLRCAILAKAEYERLGIPEDIYYDTMGCFSRFVTEHKESYGCFGFDRGFWTVRQVSCRLFRIGQLEYELVTLDSGRAVSLHIPSDTRLLTPLLRQSYLQARRLLGRVFPEYADAPMFCHSWLLSPTLAELLPPQSNILAFQRSFDVTAFPAVSMQFLQWIVKDPALPPERFPEDTGLQRKLKAFLLSGGTFLVGKGFLISEPFLPDTASG